MFCPNCGTNIENGICCPNCGAQVNEEVNENTVAEQELVKVEEAPEATESENKTKNKKKKVLTPEEQKQRKKLIKKLIVAGAFWLTATNMFCIALIVWGISINNPANEVLRNLENGYFYSAESTFEYDMNGKANKKLIEGLDKRLDEIWEEYSSDSDAYYNDVEDELETIQGMEIAEISAKLDETIAKVEALHDSREAYEDAQYEESYGDYVDAISYYAQVIPTDVNYEDAQAKIKEIMPLYRTEVFESVDDKLEYGYYDTAFELLLEAKTAFPDDKEISKKIAEYEAFVIGEADKLVADKKYDEAIGILEDALEGYPENKALSDKVTSIQNGRPVFLYDLVDSLKSENYIYNDNLLRDNNGVEHDGYFKLDAGRTDKKVASAEFQLEKKYTKFTATFVPNVTTNDKDKFTIEILVDGKVVKTIKDFTFKSENETVELDVTGASKICIRVKSTDYGSDNYISMTDACVYK